MTPSLQQSDIFSFVATGIGSLIVDAKAGTGKTTTCVWSMEYIPKGESLVGPAVIFLAFNKNIATTLQQRVPKGCVASTFHSLGLRALKDSGIVERNVKIESGKCRKMVWNACDRNDPDTQNIIRLVSLCKSVPRRPEDWDNASLKELALRYDFTLENEARSFRVVLRVLENSFANLEEIDFDDMLWLPVLLNASFDKYDYIYVDEAQDTNDIQLEILGLLCKVVNHPTLGVVDVLSRLIAVGDPHQAIYGFRGANSDSMSRIAKRFSCTTLPLTVSYRCSKNGIKEAQKIVPAIQAHPDAIDGEVKRLETYVADDFEKGSIILCRNTAPLVAFAYDLLRRDVPCKILGRDIGKQLSDLVKKMHAFSLEDLEAKLQIWSVREAAKAVEENRSAERIHDQHECLVFFISSLDEDSRSVDSLLAKIELMFTDDSNGSSSSRVTLSTVHKAKGLEFPLVFLLDKEKYMPSRYATQPWQVKQEYNLLYVAVTRAIEKFCYINSGCWKN